MEEKILYKYLTRETTLEEERELLEWLKASPENRKIFFGIKAVWETRHCCSGDTCKQRERLNRSLKQLNNRIDSLSKKKGRPLCKRLLYGSVAAIAAIGLISYLFCHPELIRSKQEYITCSNSAADTVMTVVLPDGTHVWIRENSTLYYPPRFKENLREVGLEGEAFFDVPEDSSLPFIVKTDACSIEVLGTSFSVKTHPSGDKIEAILMTGSIRLQGTDGKGLAVLHPGQQALYTRTNQTVEINEVDANSLTSWRYGLVSLSEVSLSAIIQCLENTYGINVKMDTVFLKDRRYNFSFKVADGPQKALEQLSLMTGIAAGI